MSANLGRDARGRYYPSKAARLKVHYRCAQCGRDLFRSEVHHIGHMKWRKFRGEMMHRRTPGYSLRASPWCGPVQIAPNPAYRKQHG